MIYKKHLLLHLVFFVLSTHCSEKTPFNSKKSERRHYRNTAVQNVPPALIPPAAKSNQIDVSVQAGCWKVSVQDKNPNCGRCGTYFGC